MRVIARHHHQRAQLSPVMATNNAPARFFGVVTYKAGTYR